MRISSLVLVLGLAAAGCNSSSNDTKRVSVDGATLGITTDAKNLHVAYVLGASPSVGAAGELHVATPDGKDVKVATGVSAGGYQFCPTGTGLLFSQLASGGNDASLSFLDLTTPGAQPKTLFPSGISVQPTTPGGSTNFTSPLSRVGFFTPSGRYFVLGVLQPNVAVSPDMHVIDCMGGNDIFQRPNGAFDYLELALPDDTMIFQDAVGGNDGPTGAPGVQTLFWVSLSSPGTPAKIDDRTGTMQPTGDNKTLVYQKVTKELMVWDTVARPATGTQIATNTLNFAVGQSGPVAYVGDNGSFHVVNLDGSAVVDIASAAADPFSPVYLSADGKDAYYFQNVESQNFRGTLMHVSAAAGATPAKIADKASIADVRPVAGGLLFMQNVDDLGQFGDAVYGGRDGGAPMALGSGVPVGGLGVATPKMMEMPWAAPHLTMATIDMNKMLPDLAAATAGSLELTANGGSISTMNLGTMVRDGQFAVADDLSALVYVAGSTYDSMTNNYVGALTQTALSGAKPSKILDGVTEISPVVGHTLFVNAPKAAKPGVYFVKF